MKKAKHSLDDAIREISEMRDRIKNAPEYCEMCDCSCGCHPCHHTPAKWLNS